MRAPEDESPNGQEKPYSSTESTPEWRATVEGWEWVPLDKYSSRKVGECPRCGHPMTVDAPGGTLTNALPNGPPRRVIARCHCEGEHTGHPERPNWGCGFRTNVTAP